MTADKRDEGPSLFDDDDGLDDVELPRNAATELAPVKARAAPPIRQGHGVLYPVGRVCTAPWTLPAYSRLSGVAAELPPDEDAAK